MTKTFDALTPVNNEASLNEMLKELESERSNTPHGIISRWQVINNALMRYWRFRMIYTIAGGSGSGKSYFMNQLRFDITDQEPMIVDVRNVPNSVIEYAETHGEFRYKNNTLVREPLNDNREFQVLNLHFGFEMHPIFENLRTVSSLTGYGYQYLLSSYGVRMEDDAGIRYQYNKLSDGEMKLIERIKDSLVHKMRNMLVFKQSGSRTEIYNTVYKAYDSYVKRNHNIKLCVSLDHSLLTKKAEESGDLELQNELIRTLIDIRDDFGAMVIPIIQTNSNMEDVRRRSDNGAHYPVKSDLYMGGQFYQGSDFLAVMLQPMSIGISEYGPRRVPTSNLIHWSLIKSRYNIPGQIWLWNGLEKSKILTCLLEDNTNRPIPKPNLANIKAW